MDSTNPKQTNFTPFGSQTPKKMFRIQPLPQTQKSIIARNFIIPKMRKKDERVAQGNFPPRLSQNRT